MIRDNYIGVAPNGTAMGNHMQGIGIYRAHDTLITGNLISHNFQGGITMDGNGSESVRTRITNNQIWANTGWASTSPRWEPSTPTIRATSTPAATRC